jgi:hypothetical protein
MRLFSKNISASSIILFMGFDSFMAVMFQDVVFWVVTLCSVMVGYQFFMLSPSSSWKEAAWTSETSVFYHNTTWHHNPEEFDLNHSFCFSSSKDNGHMDLCLNGSWIFVTCTSKPEWMALCVWVWVWVDGWVCMHVHVHVFVFVQVSFCGTVVICLLSQKSLNCIFTHFSSLMSTRCHHFFEWT